MSYDGTMAMDHPLRLGGATRGVHDHHRVIGTDRGLCNCQVAVGGARGTSYQVLDRRCPTPIGAVPHIDLGQVRMTGYFDLTMTLVGQVGNRGFEFFGVVATQITIGGDQNFNP